MNYFHNDLDITIGIVIINLLILLIYDLIRNHGKFYCNIIRPKLSVQNKNAWSEEKYNINKDTKGVDFDFKLQLYNHKKYYTSIYNLEIKRKYKRKLIPLENQYLNLVDTAKMVTGAVNYEKFRYATLLPFEIRELCKDDDIIFWSPLGGTVGHGKVLSGNTKNLQKELDEVIKNHLYNDYL